MQVIVSFLVSLCVAMIDSVTSLVSFFKYIRYLKNTLHGQRMLRRPAAVRALWSALELSRDSGANLHLGFAANPS